MRAPPTGPTARAPGRTPLRRRRRRRSLPEAHPPPPPPAPVAPVAGRGPPGGRLGSAYPLSRLWQLAGDPTGRRIVIGVVRPVTPTGVPYGDLALVVSAGLDDRYRLNFRVLARSLDGRRGKGAGRANSISWQALCERGLICLGGEHALTGPGAIRDFLTLYTQQQRQSTPVRPPEPAVPPDRPPTAAAARVSTAGPAPQATPPAAPSGAAGMGQGEQRGELRRPRSPSDSLDAAEIEGVLCQAWRETGRPVVSVEP